MTLEDRLRELSNYDISFEIKNSYYHISLVFDPHWEVISDNEYIYVEQRNGVYHYIASIGSVGLEDIFNMVEATIAYNKDLEKKLELFKEKTAELQEIFSKESLEVLTTLEFKFSKPKKKTVKKKTTKTEETVEKTEETTEVKENETSTVETEQPISNSEEENVAVKTTDLLYENDDSYGTYEDDEVVVASEGFLEEI